MNWHKKTYDAIIEKYRNHPKIVGETEYHHIVPRSLGGSNDKTNLVHLPIRAHCICHLLLVKIHKNDSNSYHKMICALFIMKSRKSTNISRLYEILRKTVTEHMSATQKEFLEKKTHNFQDKNHRLLKSKRMSIHVGCYTLDGIFIKEYESFKSVELLDKNFKSLQVNRAANSGKPYHGFLWKKLYEKNGNRKGCKNKK